MSVTMAAHDCLLSPCPICFPSGTYHYADAIGPDVRGGDFASTEFHWYPCMGGSHDFAVGPSRAVCNRCEKVVPLSHDDGIDISIGTGTSDGRPTA